MGNEGGHIACLHEDSARTCKPTCKSLTSTPVRDDTTGSNSFNLVAAVPGHQMAVVHVVRFIIGELRVPLVRLHPLGVHGGHVHRANRIPLS